MLSASPVVADTRPSTDSRRQRRAALGLFLVLCGVYALSAGGHTYSSDEEGMLATTAAISDRRSPVIEPIPGLTPVRPNERGEPVNYSGLAQPVVAIPLYEAGGIAARLMPGSDMLVRRIFVGWTNAWVTALGVVFFMLVARLLGASLRDAVLLALVYGLATFAWPHAKTFFSEPIGTTLALGGTWLSMRGVVDRRHRPLLVGGLLLGLAVLARSSMAIFVPLVGLYVVGRTFTRDRDAGAAARAGTWFSVGALAGAAVFLATNLWRYGDAFDLGYPNRELDGSVLEALHGFVLSPGKSLFLYAPVALLGIVAAARAPIERRWEIGLLVAMALANTLLFARFRFWQGDHAWGPRYLIITLPFLLLPLSTKLRLPRWRRATAVAAVLGFVSASLGTMMYFNQYFDVVADATGSKRTSEGAPYFYRRMYYEPYWSPIVGHARLVPTVLRNSRDRLDAQAPGLGPFPEGPAQYGWYFEAPPQLDSWAYWLFPARGPKALLVLVPVFVAGIAVGVRAMWPVLRTEASRSSYSASTVSHE